MNKIKPNLIINDDGTVHCAEYRGKFSQLSCVDCDNYQDKSCNFGALHGKQLRLDTYNRKVKCGICEREISNFWANLYYLYHKSNKINLLPLCCGCFYAFKHNTWDNAAKNRIQELKTQLFIHFSILMFACISLFISYLRLGIGPFQIHPDLPIWLSILLNIFVIGIFGGIIIFYLIPQMLIYATKLHKGKKILKSNTNFLEYLGISYENTRSLFFEDSESNLKKISIPKSETTSLTPNEIQAKMYEAGFPIITLAPNAWFIHYVPNIKRLALFGAFNEESAVSPLEYSNGGKYYPNNFQSLLTFNIARTTDQGMLYLDMKQLFRISLLFFLFPYAILIILFAFSYNGEIDLIGSPILGFIFSVVPLRMLVLCLKIKLSLRKKKKKE